MRKFTYDRPVWSAFADATTALAHSVFAARPASSSAPVTTLSTYGIERSG